jgi:hypothetical protein
MKRICVGSCRNTSATTTRNGLTWESGRTRRNREKCRPKGRSTRCLSLAGCITSTTDGPRKSYSPTDRCNVVRLDHWSTPSFLWRGPALKQESLLLSLLSVKKAPLNSALDVRKRRSFVQSPWHFAADGMVMKERIKAENYLWTARK